MRLMLALALLICLGFGAPSRMAAHALDPGFLELQPIGASEWRVVWRKPQVQGRPMPIEAELPATCTPRRPPPPVFDGRAFTSAWIATCREGIAGGRITIEGLETTSTDVLVRFVSEVDAETQTYRLTPAEPAFVLPEPQGALGVIGSYFPLGVDHILEGFDHLLFVFTLLLLLRRPKRIAGAVTAFTVAHSLTLAAATLGVINIPVPPVEAVVALSIVILAAELLRSQAGPPGWTERYPWSVAFAFGLLHGLGFASALRDIGLPQTDVPLALLAFNLGVEAGQLLFIFAVLAAGAVLRRVAGSLAGSFAPGALPIRICAYGIGTLASYWMISRIAGFGV